MLDLNHPQTKYIFEASGLVDFLLLRAQRMTLLPSWERVVLLAQCLPVLERLWRMNEEHFQASPLAFEALTETQAALEHIAHLKGGAIVEDKTDGEGLCSVCGTPITKFETYPNSGHFIIVCGECDEPFMQAKTKLDSHFGLIFI